MRTGRPSAMTEGYTRLVKHGGSYRVSLSPSVRRALNLNIGDFVHLFVRGETVVMEKVTPNFTERHMK